MSISSINYSSSVLGAQIRNINQQLTDLSTQLATGKLSQNYSGMGTNEGFAIAGRAQLSNIAAYTDTITNVNVNINLANTALQSLTTIRNTVQTGSASTAQDLNVNGQTVAQNTAAAQFGSMVGVLNTQSGNRYLFSGTAFNTQSVANAGDIINGTTTQAGLKTVMAERQAADLGANGMGRLVQYAADAELGAGSRGHPGIAVRIEDLGGLLDADGCDGHRPERLAGVVLGRSRRASTRTTATS